MNFVSIDYGYQTQVFGPPTVATSTTYIVPQSDGLSSLRITGTGFTYNGAGLPTGGVITAVELIIDANGEALSRMTNLHVSMADYGAALSGMLTLRAQFSWADVGLVDLVSWTSTYVRISNADGTFTDLHGVGFDISDQMNPIGTVTSVDLVDTDGSTVLETVSGLNEDIPDFLQAMSQEMAADALLMLLHTGDNTVVYNEVTVGSTVYTSGLMDGPGNDTYSGGGPGPYTPTVDFEFSNAAVTADLSAGTATHGGDIETFLGTANLVGTRFNDSLTGDDADNIFDAREGNDILNGGEGNDTLEGDFGDDTLNGGDGFDTAFYGDEDIQTGVTVSLAIAGPQDAIGAGIDTLIDIENLSGTDLADTLTGDGDSNAIFGNAGADTINGGAGNDTITGGDDDDLINGGDGDDVFNISFADGADAINGGTGSDLIAVRGTADDNTLSVSWNGSSFTLFRDQVLTSVELGWADLDLGSDTLDFDGSSVGVSVNLLAGTATGFSSIVGVESAVGGGFNDTLTGSNGNNALYGRDGDDLLSGNAGDDILNGEGGNDLLSGGDGNDILNAGVGADTVSGGAGSDNVVGDDGNDTLSGNDGDDTMLGGGGDDTLNGGVGADDLDGGLGVDTLSYAGSASGVSVNLAAGVVSGGDAAGDTITGFENVTGSSFADTMIGNSGANNLVGGAGNDTITAGGGVDIVNGGDGDDVINYNFGDGVDSAINGGAGTDRIVTFGNVGGETLDAFWNGTSFTGFKGSSVASIEQATADMGGGVDWLRQHNTSLAVTINLALGTATGFISIANIENAWGSAYNDILTGSAAANVLRGAAGDDQIDGGDGADTLIGEDGLDTILGGAGADTIYGLSGADTVNGGDGDDIIFYSFGEGVDAIDGGDGTDTIICNGNSGAETLEVAWDGTSFTFFKGGAVTNIEQAQANMGVGGDWVRFTNSSVGVTIDLGANTASGFTSLVSVENASGGAFDDAITGSGVANNLVGNAGADTINGAGGNDTINGGAGVDAIIGGAGSDTLIGGGDADTFVFATGSGVDSIADFDANPNGGQDILDISGYGITTGDFGARVTIQDLGANTLITIDGTNTILLSGVTGDGNNVITQADFLLA